MMKRAGHIDGVRCLRRRGSALVMAIVTTMLLFIIGIAFMIRGQMQRTTLSSYDDQDTLGIAVDVVVDEINDTLVADLLGGNGVLLDADDGDEYWDYPGADDRWLASLEPVELEYGNGWWYGWPHITDLWGQFTTVQSDGTDLFYIFYYDPDDRSNVDESDSVNYGGGTIDSNVYRRSAYRMVAKIVSDDDEIEPTILDNNVGFYLSTGISTSAPWNPGVDEPLEISYHGMRADADGDGVADSRWVRLDGEDGVPRLVDATGEYIYAAVRIVDNGGMLNINTAYRDPGVLTGMPHAWDGTQLSQVDLDGIVSSTDLGNGFSAINVQAWRCGEVSAVGDIAPDDEYDNDTEYEEGVSRRLANPDVSLGLHVGPGGYAFEPFDISDELELRNRLLMKGRTTTRAEVALPVTFDPPLGAVGVQYPYVDDVDLPNWFNKLKPDIDESTYSGGLPIGDYNRRHLVTTWNCDRILRPGGGGALPTADMVDVAGQRQCGILLPSGIQDGTAPHPDVEAYVANLAAALWRGLPDDDATIQARFGADYTREMLACQWAVNLVDYQDDDNTPDGGNDDLPTYVEINGRQYFGVENVTALQRDCLQISELGYADLTNPSAFDPCITANTPTQYYAIEIFNPGTTAKNLGDYEAITLDPCGTEASFSGGSVSVPAGGVVVLVNDPCAIYVFGVSTVEEDSGLSFGVGDYVSLVRTGYPDTGYDMPVDAVEVPINDIIVSDDAVHTIERTLEIGDGSGSSTNLLLAYFNSTTDTIGDPPLASVASNMQMGVPNGQLTNVGQIVNAFAVGFSYESGEPVHALGRDIYDAIDLLFADTEIGTLYRLLSYGRVNLADQDYFGVLNYLTYFDPSNDGVDNDGDTMTSDDPSAAGLDPALARSYEQQIWGRININTAPWYVINQLPWVGLDTMGGDTTDLARAIVAFRDKQDLSWDGGPEYAFGNDGTDGREEATKIVGISESPGFTNIEQLMQVTMRTSILPPPPITSFDIRKYMNGADEAGMPDMSPGDNIDDDFEERDLIFQRISNLVTVRSDVFTAYILVRIGVDGPQRRMIAIFDRSGVYENGDRARLLALHPVPDPR